MIDDLSHLPSLDEWPIVGQELNSRGDGYYAIRQSPEGQLACECVGNRKWGKHCRHLKSFITGRVPVIKFKIIFKRSLETIAVIEGAERELEGLAIGDVTERIIETEQYLERLTGLRVHIESEA